MEMSGAESGKWMKYYYLKGGTGSILSWEQAENIHETQEKADEDHDKCCFCCCIDCDFVLVDKNGVEIEIVD